MLSIGWVMFWKAIVLAVWTALAERWRHYKKQRRAGGIELRYDERRAVYYDPIQRLESRVKLALWIASIPLGLYAALVLYLVLTA